MPDNTIPIISMADEGESMLIQRSLPEPVAYSGKSFIALSFDGAQENPRDFFTDAAFDVPSDREGAPFGDIGIDDLKVSVHTAMVNGFSESRIFPNVRPTSSALRLVESPNPGARIEGSTPITRELRDLSADTVAAALKAGKRVHIFQNLAGGQTYRLADEPKEAVPRLLLVEQYQLSTHLGHYGAGRVVKTFSLLSP